MSYPELLEAEFCAFDIRTPPHHQALLAQYCSELERWNQKINLTGLRGSQLVRRLIAEPAWIGRQLEMSGVLADIGSGNGSPGLPLHILCPLTRTYLIEARAKRVAFLRHIVSTLKMPEVVVEHGRFENVVSDVAKVDWITLQGVALDLQVIESIRRVAKPTTLIVWITAGAAPPIAAIRRLKVPVTGTEVLLFRALDEEGNA